MRNDSLLALENHLRCIITLGGYHNHNVRIPSSSKHLKLTQETKETFIGYFHSGLSPSQSIRVHESLLMEKEKETNSTLLGYASINPKINSVSHLYNIWKKKKHFVDGTSLNKLKQNLEEYKKRGKY
jgi:hypothetical protein